MDHDHVAEAIAALEEELVRDDPGLERRLERLVRRDRAHVPVAFALLASGTCLFATGLGAQAPIALVCGLVLLALSILCEPLHLWVLRHR